MQAAAQKKRLLPRPSAVSSSSSSASSSSSSSQMPSSSSPPSFLSHLPSSSSCSSYDDGGSDDDDDGDDNSDDDVKDDSEEEETPTEGEPATPHELDHFYEMDSESKAEDTQEPRGRHGGGSEEGDQSFREVDQTEAEMMETKAEHAEAANLSDENDVFQVPQAADRTRAISSQPAATSLPSQRRRKRGIYNKINPRKKRRASQVESEPEREPRPTTGLESETGAIEPSTASHASARSLSVQLLILLNLMIMLIM